MSTERKGQELFQQAKKLGGLNPEVQINMDRGLHAPKPGKKRNRKRSDRDENTYPNRQRIIDRLEKKWRSMDASDKVNG